MVMNSFRSNDHIPARYDVENVDLASVDGVLSTTRSVRLRLDLDRTVPNELILECIDVAEQGPGGGNQSSRRWLIIRDPEQKKALIGVVLGKRRQMDGLRQRQAGWNRSPERKCDAFGCPSGGKS